MKALEPQLIVDARFYSTENGGKKESFADEYFGCLCTKRRDVEGDCWDGRVMLNGSVLEPGSSMRVGIVFLSGETAAADLRAAGKFYLWSGRIIGEAEVVG